MYSALTELYSYFGDNKSLSKFFPDEIINLPNNQLKIILGQDSKQLKKYIDEMK